MHITEPMTTVCVMDVAIDESATTWEGMREFIRTRDPKHLAFSGKPTRFTLRQISRDTVADIKATATNEARRYELAFAHAVVRAENLYPDDGGRAVETWEPASPKSGLTRDELARFTPAEIEDIGAVAWARSFLGMRNVRRFVLPRSLVAALGQMMFPTAEPSEQTTNNEMPSDAEGC